MYTPDRRIAKKILQKLQKAFSCPEGAVIAILKSLTKKWMRSHPGYRADIGQYQVVMDVADKVNDRELAKLMHLYRVGYFVADTKKYQPLEGEEYKIVNENYTYGINQLKKYNQ